MLGRTNAVVINGSTDFGYTVDFISDGANYARYIVTDGQSVAKPTPDPTKSGLHFRGWQNESESLITFPYTPSDDVTLTASFQTTRNGMTLTQSGKTICVLLGRPYVKKYAEWCIAGYIFDGTRTGPLLVGLTEAAVTYQYVYYDYYTVGSAGTISYKGQTYHYSGSGGDNGNVSSSPSDVSDLQKVENPSRAAAAEWLVKRYLYEI